jgi:hypothetical protein
MATNQLSLARARAAIGLVPLILAAVQTIALYLTLSAFLTMGDAYDVPLLWRFGAQRLVPLTIALFGIATFALPAIIGVFSRTWRSALVLAVLPWWIAIIAQAGTLLTPYIGLAASGRGRIDAPFWLSASELPLLLGSLALFAALGYLGWLARRAFAGE